MSFFANNRGGIIVLHPGKYNQHLIELLSSLEHPLEIIDYEGFTPNPSTRDLTIMTGPFTTDTIYSITKAIKKQECLPAPLIVCVLPSENVNEKTNLYKAGIDDVILETVSDDEFLARVQKQWCNSQIILQLEAINETKEKFLSIISHDLRNPFTILLNFTEILWQRFDQFTVPKQKEYITFINESARQSYSILENLLRWSRAHSGDIEFSPTRLDLTEIIYESIIMQTNLINEKNLTVFFNRENSIYIHADRNMLYVIMNNLLLNAITYSYKDGNILVSVEPSDGIVELTITDKGAGIERDRLDHLFKLDMIVKTPGTMNEKGAGLGLLIIKEFIEKHGGKIRVKSSVGQGSTFSIVLPTGT